MVKRTARNDNDAGIMQDQVASIAACSRYSTCTHGNTDMCVYVHLRSKHIPSLMNPPVQARSFFSGDGDDERFRKGTTTTASKTGTSASSSPDDTSTKLGRPPDIYRAKRTRVGEIASCLPSPAGNGVGEEGDGCVCAVCRGVGWPCIYGRREARGAVTDWVEARRW